MMGADEMQALLMSLSTPREMNEDAFQQWYKGWAQLAGIDPNPDNPLHYYNFRDAYLAGVTPRWNPEDQRFHWDSRFKTDEHTNRFVQTDKGIIDTRSGELLGQGKATVTDVMKSVGHRER